MTDKDILERIEKDVLEIKNCLMGSLGDDGLVKRVRDLERHRGLIQTQVAALLALVPIVSAIVIYFINH